MASAAGEARAEAEPGDAGVALTVVGLSGGVIVDVVVQGSDTVRGVKQRIFELRPSTPPRWQRLVLGGRVLLDEEAVGALGCAGGAALQLLATVQPGDLLGDAEVAGCAREALGHMTAAAVRPHLAGLLEDAEGRRLPPAAAADVLNQLRQRHPRASGRWGCGCGVPGCGCGTAVLRAALLPLAVERLLEGQAGRLVPLFEWLGEEAVPRLVAWLGLLDRPLAPQLRGTAEQFRKHDSARVRLAARAALDGRGARSAARAEELACLRAGLRRSAAAAGAAEERAALEELAAAFSEKLRELAERGESPKACYAARRALRR